MFLIQVKYKDSPLLPTCQDTTFQSGLCTHKHDHEEHRVNGWKQVVGIGFKQRLMLMKYKSLANLQLVRGLDIGEVTLEWSSKLRWHLTELVRAFWSFILSLESQIYILRYPSDWLIWMYTKLFGHRLVLMKCLIRDDAKNSAFATRTKHLACDFT